jgi:hypothetical protein
LTTLTIPSHGDQGVCSTAVGGGRGGASLPPGGGTWPWIGWSGRATPPAPTVKIFPCKKDGTMESGMEPGDKVEVHDGAERVRTEGPAHGRCMLEASWTGGGSLGKKIPHTFFLRVVEGASRVSFPDSLSAANSPD